MFYTILNLLVMFINNSKELHQENIEFTIKAILRCSEVNCRSEILVLRSVG